MAQRTGPTRAEVTEGVQRRLDATLHALPGLHLEPVPAQFLRKPDTPTGVRVLRGGRLPGAGDDAYEAIAELWRESGCAVVESAGLLLVEDPRGYVISVARHEDEAPILTVASPAVPAPYLDRGLVAGLLAGLGFGCLGPCLTTLVPSALIPALAGSTATYWAWLPLFLLVAGGSLWFPDSRRFGLGLLVAGTLIGLPVAMTFG
ncbi:hypothetical protein GCM10010172_75770 [Paractinoplanes ferrugineus]|uniref:Uncharacterized protein n=1 Tax=Paractinoplanes ferrugineus TaxID=113564 RepID=A0A919MD06_9ACTN|nr:hypothetical protein [Actinoplanes ferrugineus]GIE11268.1 hypothetical protein Afe05nite_31080 [Actinoplanes ferrugineus]